MRKTRVALAIVAAYLILIFFAHLPDHLILFPTKAPIDAGGAVRKTVPFQNGELELWTAVSQRAQQNGRSDIYILRFYGNADRAERWVAAEADEWNDRAVEIWGMNQSCSTERVSAHAPRSMLRRSGLPRGSSCTTLRPCAK